MTNIQEAFLKSERMSMKNFNRNEIKDIVKLVKKSGLNDEYEYNFLPSFFFWPSVIMFIFALTALHFWLKNPNGVSAFFIITLGFGALTFLGTGIETCFTSSTLIFKKKYGEHFTQEETNLLFENYRLPLCKSWFGTKVKKFENEVDEENFECKMKNEALCQRVEFFLENEVPEELRKEKEKIEKLQEEKRMEDKKTEARFKKYMDQYATGLETEKE